MADRVVMAVDVGTGSARAGVFDAAGRMLGRAVRPIEMNRTAPDHAERDSSDIWRAVYAASREALAASGAPAAAVAGLGSDATCSLAAAVAGGTGWAAGSDTLSR